MKIKKAISILNILFAICVMSLPYFVLAQETIDASNALVKCKTVDDCNWQEFLNTVNRVKDYVMQIVVLMSVIFIAIAGFWYLTSAGDPGKISKAKSILQNVVIGFFLASAGWLIVRTILKTLGADDERMVPVELRS